MQSVVKRMEMLNIGVESGILYLGGRGRVINSEPIGHIYLIQHVVKRFSIES